MCSAARGGHKEIVQMMLDSGANNYDWSIANAALKGHKEIVQMITIGQYFMLLKVDIKK
jgi:hypothetical protein